MKVWKYESIWMYRNTTNTAVVSLLPQAYYGGEARCAEQANVTDDYDPTELVCPACSNVGGAVQVRSNPAAH